MARFIIKKISKSGHSTFKMLEGEIEAESLNLGVVLRHQYERLIPDERIFLDILDGFRHTKDIDDFPDHIDISFLGVFCWKIGN